MEKSISNAFTYMFKDEDWKYKLGILAMLSFPAMYQSYLADIKGVKEPLLILSILAAITSIIISGFYAKCTQNVIFSESETPNLLPKWEDSFFHYFVIGLKKIVATIIIYIIMIPASILVIPAVIFAILYPALERVFCTEFKVTSYFSWKRATSLRKQNPSLYIKILLLPFLIILFFVVIMFVITEISPLLFAIISPLIICYFFLVYAYLVGMIGSEENVVSDEYGLVAD